MLVEVVFSPPAGLLPLLLLLLLLLVLVVTCCCSTPLAWGHTRPLLLLLLLGLGGLRAGLWTAVLSGPALAHAAPLTFLTC
jgi:hypothetical protein